MRGNSWRWQCGAFDAVPADVVGSHHLQITFSENIVSRPRASCQ